MKLFRFNTCELVEHKRGRFYQNETERAKSIAVGANPRGMIFLRIWLFKDWYKVSYFWGITAMSKMWVSGDDIVKSSLLDTEEE